MFKFKKIASALASTAMIGSTIALAAATSFPAPFADGSASDVAVIYGASGAVTDIAAATDIASSISSNLATTSSTSTSTTCEGDCVILSKSSDNINLADTWAVFTGSVDDDDLTTLLADGTYTAGDNDDFDYEQKITLGSPTLSHFRDSDYESLVGLDDKTPTIGFKISSNTWIMNYTLDFTQDAESDYVSGGTDMDDIEGSDLPLLGNSYYVSDLKNVTGPTFFGKMTLLDSANSATVREGEPVTVTVDGVTYEVSITFIDDDEVRFNVNGETVPASGKLQAGQSAKIADGAYIGVRSVDKLVVSDSIGSSSFSIGSGKLEITSGSDIKLNDETIQGVKGYVYRASSPTIGTQKIDKIVIEWKTDEEEFISPETELVMPGFEVIKFSMADFIRPEEEKITIEKDGDTSIKLDVPIKDGEVSLNILYTDSTGNFTGIGKASDDRLATSGNGTLHFQEKDSDGNDYHSYFVASYNITQEAESYLLRALITTNTDAVRNETTIQKKVNGAWVDICENKVDSDTCDIGDVSLTIGRIQYTSGGTETVELRAGSNTHFNTIFTNGGLAIYLPYEGANSSTALGLINLTGRATNPTTTGHDDNSWYLYMDGEDKDDNLLSGTGFSFTLNDNSDKNLQVQHVNTTGGNAAGEGSGGENGLEIGDTSTYEAYVKDDVAPRILHYTKPDEDWAEVYYPTGDSESYAEVRLSSSDVSFTTTSSIVPITDAEASSASGKNIIVVGGTCINSVAASLLGVPTGTCGADFTAATKVGAGEYLIQSFPRTGDKVATLVAGYNAGDTTNAATALTTQTVDTTAGKKYTGTTSTSITAAIA